MAAIRRSTIAFLSLALSQSTSADEFSWEVRGGMARIEFGSMIEIDTTTLSGSYYFQPVDDTQGPLALAAFLSRSSDITFSAQRNKTESTALGFAPGISPPPIQVTEENSVYRLQGRYVWRDSGWFAGGGLSYQDLDNSIFTLSFSDRHEDGVRVVGGKYFGRSTAVQLSAETTTESSSSTLALGIGPQLVSNTEVETDVLTLSARHVGQLASMQYSVTGQALASDSQFTISNAIVAAPGAPIPGISFGPGIGIIGGTGARPFTNPVSLSADTQRAWSVGGELYPTNRLGIQIGYTSYSSFGVLDNRFEIGTQWFINNRIAIELVVARSNFDSLAPDTDQDEFQFRAIGRL